MDNSTNTPAKVQSYELANNDHTKHLADIVADFIDQKKLFTLIQGKKYVNVEGWLYAGSQLSILPVVVKVEDISREYEENGNTKTEIRYRAEAKLVNIHSQQQVGYGVAMCSNREQKKKFFDEYAIRSMAETRAVGKAYRLMIGWLMSAAGYNPTPFEEVDGILEEPAAKKEPNSKKQSVAITEAVAEAVESMPTLTGMTVNQKTQLLLLLNNTLITKEEKDKMVAKLNTIDKERAEKAIAKLKDTIKERGSDGYFPHRVDEQAPGVASFATLEKIENLLLEGPFSEQEIEDVRVKIVSGDWSKADAEATYNNLKLRIKNAA